LRKKDTISEYFNVNHSSFGRRFDIHQMAHCWFQVEDADDEPEDGKYFGIFTERPAVIAARLPRPPSPFVSYDDAAPKFGPLSYPKAERTISPPRASEFASPYQPGVPKVAVF
jgi:hypothetical protein